MCQASSVQSTSGKFVAFRGFHQSDGQKSNGNSLRHSLRIASSLLTFELHPPALRQATSFFTFFSTGRATRVPQPPPLSASHQSDGHLATVFCRCSIRLDHQQLYPSLDISYPYPLPGPFRWHSESRCTSEYALLNASPQFLEPIASRKTSQPTPSIAVLFCRLKPLHGIQTQLGW